MGKESILLAKVAGLKKNFDNVEFRGERCLGQSVEHLFTRYKSVIEELKELNNDLYGDIPEVKIPDKKGVSSQGSIYEQHTIRPLIQNLEYILELNAHFRIGSNLEDREKAHRIFISHGTSNEWFKVQNYIDKDLNVGTLELAQQPNLGRTILQKLNEEADKCSIAVIVMTGDDIIGHEIRARENVMHEIGYFQGKYGLRNVVLLHEVGVNIPSNIDGLVYISFPKDTAEASLGAITRELNVLLN